MIRWADLLSESNDVVFKALGDELTRAVPDRASSNFVATIRGLPPGLRAMAATYELDVSLCLDDLGWHFGNWHDLELAEETALGLEELGATELAVIFRAAFSCARRYWKELEADEWMQWYHGSGLEAELDDLNKRAWQILEGRWNGIFSYWVEYARQYPERLGARADA
jgi:hypothetical protein